jgi:Uma2 family endonuclease
MNWQEVCDDPNLKNLPFKIELNEYGKIVMSPAKVYHSAFQGEIEYLLRSLLKTGKSLPECAIATRKGTKVADVAWVSNDRFQKIRGDAECSIAPEICIEITSSSNSHKEMTEKRALYFEAGAEEVWICNEDGRVSFYDRNGLLDVSKLVENFPSKIEL